ncbi:MAG: L-asparaginase 1 [Candidatus Heimdallarchaeota archaeon LC_2]|nr:MAG: L-asparaginase 1 [Candidatus Heimdallarchaeota archaeon LC_2]
MKKIKILGIGGTISSLQSNEGFKPGISVESIIQYIPRVLEYYTLEVEEIMMVDSANLQPEDWIIIAEKIKDNLNDVTVHGVVLTHGTDTMAYSAAATSILLRNITKPVVFTGSQIPLEIFSSDAQRNLIDAIRVAGETNIAESVIVFNSKVYRGSRTIKLREYDLSAFETIDPFPLAEISRTIDIIDPFIKTRSKAQTWLDGGLNVNVALIKIFPGLDPKIIENLPELGYEGIVLECYGAGNIPILKRSLVKCIKNLRSMNIPVIITSMCIYGRAELYLYETGKMAKDAGAISGFDMLSEVALIKLMWALNKTNDFDEIKDIIYSNVAGEINTVIGPLT